VVAVELGELRDAEDGSGGLGGVPQNDISLRSVLPIIFAVFISAIGYGITFPLISIRLEQTGVSGLLIGLNAMMPALGWVAGSAFVPVMQLRWRISIATLAVAFMLCAATALAGLRYADTYVEMTALRFFFGGSMGLFYRSVEYWINTLSPDHLRGRNLSMNGVAFMLGLVIGSVAQPLLGATGWTAFGPAVALLIVTVLSTAIWPRHAPPPRSAVSVTVVCSSIAALPIAFVAVFAYGLDESVVAYLAQIYALKNGLGTDVAAYTLTAAALGNILIPIPIALASDRIGRMAPLVACALAASATSLIIPYTLHDPKIFLTMLMISAGAAGTVYGLALAMIGDRFQSADLVVANAAFGIVYSIGSIIGPLLNGAAIDTLNSHGLMVVSGLIYATLSVTLIGRSLWEGMNRSSNAAATRTD
jgi:MFS family permease